MHDFNQEAKAMQHAQRNATCEEAVADIYVMFCFAYFPELLEPLKLCCSYQIFKKFCKLW